MAKLHATPADIARRSAQWACANKLQHVAFDWPLDPADPNPATKPHHGEWEWTALGWSRIGKLTAEDEIRSRDALMLIYEAALAVSDTAEQAADLTTEALDARLARRIVAGYTPLLPREALAGFRRILDGGSTSDGDTRAGRTDHPNRQIYLEAIAALEARLETHRDR